MKKTKLISIFLITFLVVTFNFIACEQEDLDFYIDCDKCLVEIPEFDTLWVELTINEENQAVPLTFYFGDYENGEIDYIDTAYSNEFWLVSTVGVDYSVKATYIVDGEPVVAVDGDRIRVVNGEGDCYPPCYYTRGGTLDLRLKD